MWLDIAHDDIGLQAIKGRQHEPRIVAMFALCGADHVCDDETPWCAGAVGAWLARSGIKGTGRLDAKSYLTFGEHLDAPRAGAIAIVRNKNGSHHVALVENCTENHVDLIGGNQGHSAGRSEVNISRYRRGDHITYRWPIPIKSASDIEADGSRHMAKGRQDIVGGWMTTVTGVGTGVAAINSTTEATSGLMGKLLANPWPFVAMFGMTLIGVYMIAGGHLLRQWRVTDHNTGRKRDDH